MHQTSHPCFEQTRRLTNKISMLQNAYAVYTENPQFTTTDTTHKLHTYIKHVIQERYPRAAVGNASAIQVNLHMHFRLLGYPLDLSQPRRR
jgi:hypothetical protein